METEPAVIDLEVIGDSQAPKGRSLGADARLAAVRRGFFMNDI